jgi:hypothetical protein
MVRTLQRISNVDHFKSHLVIIAYNYKYLKQVEELKSDWLHEKQDFAITSKDIIIASCVTCWSYTHLGSCQIAIRIDDEGSSAHKGV